MIYVIYAKHFDVNLIDLNLFHATDYFLYPTVNIRQLCFFMFSAGMKTGQWHEMD